MVLTYGTAGLLASLAIGARAADGKFDISNSGRPFPPLVLANSLRAIDYAGIEGHENLSVTLGSSSSTFNRPLTCSDLSTKGRSAPYEAVVVRNSGLKDAVLNLRLGVAGDPHRPCGEQTDTMIVVYKDFFEPASPLTNCLAINDDAVTTGDRCSTLTGLELRPGERRVIVLTTFESTNKLASTQSQYELSFSGSLPVTLLRFAIE
ncbi:hypothetical protein ACQQ2N_04535 [Dokdonella sp. MW10]|uniref:hypothetical protein n=1 Tax=Dokdonella sp. MW10 TaxID=2992926 RepID=UPI003F7DBB88